LFFKINIFNLNIPPLRERPEDIIFWAIYFVNLYSNIFNKGHIILTQDSCGLLTKYNWSGNIFEMENIIERAVVLSENGKITPNELNINFSDKMPTLRDYLYSFFDIKSFVDKKIPLADFLDEIEEIIIRTVIKETGYVQVRAAEVLGITKSLLQYKLRKYNISV
jgi:two-component system, NtrC family, response regulator